MKKYASFLFVIVVFAALGIAKVLAAPSLVLDDIEVEYTPEGYMPTVALNGLDHDLTIGFLAINKTTSAPESLPLVNVGEYVVKASVHVNGVEYTDVATIVIKPVKATIVVEYDKLAHTGEPIIPEYSVVPAWAEDYLNISSEYYHIDNASETSTKVEAPTRIGKYFVKMSASEEQGNILCDGKAYVLTIAEKKGKKLSSDDASSPVGEDISAVLEEKTVIYTGESQNCGYTASPNVDCIDVYYRAIGSSEEPTMTPPVEPGEYEVFAVLCNVELDRNTFLIKKITPDYQLESDSYAYDPLGIIPKVTSPNNEELKFDLSVYAVDDELNTGDSVRLPIMEPGRYLIIINPVDTVHYESIYSSEYITVEKCVPTITTKTENFRYDGFEKAVAYEVLPSWAENNIVYYELNKNGTIKTVLGSRPPINVGEYVAEITVPETNHVEGTTIKVDFSILEKPESNTSRGDVSKEDFFFLGIASAEFVAFAIFVPIALITIFLIYVYYQRKHNK